MLLSYKQSSLSQNCEYFHFVSFQFFHDSRGYLVFEKTKKFRKPSYLIVVIFSKLLNTRYDLPCYVNPWQYMYSFVISVAEKLVSFMVPCKALFNQVGLRSYFHSFVKKTTLVKLKHRTFWSYWCQWTGLTTSRDTLNIQACNTSL